MRSFSPETRVHEPVLLKEVVALLNPRPGQVVVDGTLGSGGHAKEIMQYLGPQGRLIGLDQDPEALERAKRTLEHFTNVEFLQANFSELEAVLKRLNLNRIDAVLLDVGLSSEQLGTADRGFSFLKEGSLDMRMDPRSLVTARDLVNDLSQGELETLFRESGEERWSKRIAAAVSRERQKKPIETTRQLTEIIEKSVPRPARFGPRHPAMRVFQALRIRVNRELAALEETLPQAFRALKRGGRLAVISFHSLEDRIVKQTFREWLKRGEARVLTPKPVRATEEEMRRNPRSRSAKLRVVERIKNS